MQYSNVTAAWLPDTYFLYRDKLSDYDLDDTRMMSYEQRFMITTNELEPQVYAVSKVVNVSPKGIIKFTFKQAEYDEKRDNVKLLICNYYNDSGEIQIEEHDPVIDPDKTSVIYHMIKRPDGSWDKDTNPVVTKLGEVTYYTTELSTTDDVYLEWRTELVYSPIEDINKMTDEKKLYYCNLLKITKYNNKEISIKIGKAKAIVGMKYKLYVQDNNGNYYSSMELEVTD